MFFFDVLEDLFLYSIKTFELHYRTPISLITLSEYIDFLVRKDSVFYNNDSYKQGKDKEFLID